MDQLADEKKPRRTSLTSDAFAAIAVTFELLLYPAAVALAWLWGGPEVPPAQLNADHARLGVLYTLPPLAFLALLLWTPLRNVRPLRRIHLILKRSFGRAISGLQVWQVLAISLAAGVGEEALFRGALQPRVGLYATSAIFGAVHWITPTYFVFAVGMGLYLGWIYENSQENLLVPIIVHALYDALALLALRSQLRKKRPVSG